MTAIADIIVNPSAEQQVKELQLSQAYQNQNITQNSSKQISFADLLNSTRLNEETVKTENSTEENKPEENLKKTVDSEKTESSKNDEKVDEKQNAKSSVEEKKADKQIDVKKTDYQPKENTETTKDKKQVKTEKNIQKKTDVKDEKNDKKLESELNRFAQLMDNVQKSVENEEIAGEVNAELSLSNEIKVENNSLDENQIKIETSEIGQIIENKESSDNSSLSKTKFEKTSKLDKDGKIIVKDLRTDKSEVDEEKNEKSELKLDSKLEITDKNTATITMDLANQNAENNILSLNNQSAASDGSNFQAMLNNQIQQNAPEFVKAGSLILKDNDQGTINLVLHPDDLGNVKIHLSLDGKTVSAHITVNTKEALEVFKENAQTLKEAFVKNGFDTSNFDVSYSNQNGQNSQNFENQYDGSEFIAKRAYGSGNFAGEGQSDYIENEKYFENYSEYSINIVA